MACDVYVEVRVPEARSNMKIWPLSTDKATREPSGLYNECVNRLSVNGQRKTPT